jgi:hypothetical protein
VLVAVARWQPHDGGLSRDSLIVLCIGLNIAYSLIFFLVGLVFGR